MNDRLNASAQIQFVRVVAKLALPSVSSVINNSQLSTGLLNTKPPNEAEVTYLPAELRPRTKTWQGHRTLTLRCPTQLEQ